MPLDLMRVAAQVGGMIAGLRDSRRERQEHLRNALETLHNKTGDIEALRSKIAASKTSWLVADFVEKPDNHYPVPPLPADFTVIGVDGSQIDVDRHQSTRCYLINLGSAIIRYGSAPDAVLDSVPHLYSDDEDLVISDGAGREQAIEGQLLGLKRSVDECLHLAELAAKLPSGSISLGLLDGSLIMWSLESYPDFINGVLLRNGFLKHLDDLKKLNAERKVPVASYISLPRSTDVVNVLRVALCPHAAADCDKYCREKRECDVVARVQDRDLFSDVLGAGERSAVFISNSKVQRYYGIHRVCFFYLKTGDEIARVEVPQWVASDESLLNITHSLVLDQCQRGQAYPVVLSEAHEQAVVTNVDRQNFWQLVESASVDEHLSSFSSAKSMSKRTRWV
ncbi:MAG: DNA double-strand break repair nuclease NurA [Dehalococcoidales bacterium]|nr:DNA double-strand break repair nuclease NurA [Dehalococcoidales bacterium]